MNLKNIDCMLEEIENINLLEQDFKKRYSTFIKNISRYNEEDIINFFDNIINKYLLLISKNIDVKKKIKSDYSLDEFLSFYYDDKFEELYFECSCVVEDLILKSIKYNNREIELPINIQSLIDYGLSTVIKKNEIRFALLWISFRLIYIYKYITNN